MARVGARGGRAVLDGVADRLGDHQRFHAVRAHLLERAGETQAAIDEFGDAASRATNARERHYLIAQAARLGAPPEEAPR